MALALSVEVTRTRRLLLVDDDPLTSSGVQRVLRPLGAIDAVADEEQALAKLQAVGRYDVVLWGLSCVTSPIERLLDEVDTRQPGASRRVVFIGEADATVGVRELDRVGTRVLSKPFRAAELLRIAQESLGDG